MNENREILRYLGIKGNCADDMTLKSIDFCINKLNKLPPKIISREFPLKIDDGVLLGKLKIESKNLKKHLEGCEKAVLFAATLGAEADFLIERTSKTDIAKAVIMQACAAVKIEGFCDDFENNLAKEVEKDGFHLKPRYSPGYGDFSIEHQRDIIRILDSQKRIGLSMTDSFMLVPTKSVTAVIGITKDKQGCVTSKCKKCGLKDCPFRKD